MSKHTAEILNTAEYGCTQEHEVLVDGHHIMTTRHEDGLWYTTTTGGTEVAAESLEEAVGLFMAMDEAYEQWSDEELTKELASLSHGVGSEYAGWGRDELINEIVAAKINS